MPIYTAPAIGTVTTADITFEDIIKQTPPSAITPYVEPPPPEPEPPKRALCPVAATFETWAKRCVADWVQQVNQGQSAFTQTLYIDLAFASLFKQQRIYRKLYPDHTGYGDELHICVARIVDEVADSLDEMLSLVTPAAVYTEAILKRQEKNTQPASISWRKIREAINNPK